MAKTVLITVGTTKFEDLIKYTDTQEFVKILRELGFDRIIYQIGTTYPFQ